MSDEIRLEGLGVAPGVLETIVTLAAGSVEGVAHVGTPGLAGVVKKKGAAKSVEFDMGEDGMSVAVHVHAEYGRPLRAVARAVQEAVADALESQVGNDVASVDVFVDGIVFAE